MGPEYYRNLIEREHMNRPVGIRLHDGTVHQGIVRRVDGTHVHLEPIDGVGGVGGVSGLDGPGVFAWGWGFGFPIALASIAAIGALGWLWWQKRLAKLTMRIKVTNSV